MYKGDSTYTRRMALSIVSGAVLLLGVLFVLVPEGSDGIGNIGAQLYVDPDYEGSNTTGPVDISDRGEKDILISGYIVVNTTYPHILQDVEITLTLRARYTFSEDGSVSFISDPEVIRFDQLLPGETYIEYFNLTVTLTNDLKPDGNTLILGGRYANSPGVIGGTIDPIDLPMDIVRYESGMFDGMTEIRIEEGDSEWWDYGIHNYGNSNPGKWYIEIDDNDAMSRDIRVDLDGPGFEYSLGECGWFELNFDCTGAQSGDHAFVGVSLLGAEDQLLYEEDILITVTESSWYADDDDDDPDDDTGDDDDWDDDSVEDPGIEITIETAYYKFSRREYRVASDIFIRGTTSGCSVLWIGIMEGGTGLFEENTSWYTSPSKVDRLESIFLYPYDIAEFRDTSGSGDWSSFELHLKYDQESYFMKIDLSPGTLVGEKATFKVRAFSDDDLQSYSEKSKEVTIVEGNLIEEESGMPMFLILGITAVVLILIAVVVFFVVRVTGKG